MHVCVCVCWLAKRNSPFWLINPSHPNNMHMEVEPGCRILSLFFFIPLFLAPERLPQWKVGFLSLCECFKTYVN